jgi:hypothetical protein
MMAMYTEHASFTAPSNPDAPLWRYMDLARFLAIMEDQVLFFARADLMADKFEGAVGPATETARALMMAEYYALIQPVWARGNEVMRYFTYLNCWHASDYESAAMWGLYQRDGRGVAIKSTFRRFTQSLKGNHKVFAGIVHYVDYHRHPIPERNSFAPFTYKRLSFKHEQEVRAVTQDIESGATASREGVSIPELSATARPGLHVPVDLMQLVEAVHIAPEAGGWFKELVEKLVRRYGYEWPVKHSDLQQDPLY